MQLTGDRFTSEAALFGNDLATQPNYPAEIRAPQGTLPGVSSFQIQIADYDILTAGDRPDVLVAMNPAALKANLSDLPRGGTGDRQLRRVHQAQSGQGRLRGQPAGDRRAVRLRRALGADDHADPRARWSRSARPRRTASAPRTCSPSVCCPGCTAGRSSTSETFVREKFARKPEIAEANVLALRAGWNYGETTEAFATTYEVAPAKLAPGRVPADLRQHRPGLRHHRRRAAGRRPGGARQLPDHPGLGHPARAVQAQELQRA